MNKYQNAIKFCLSALFIICVMRMPYGFYQMVRFMGLLGFLLLAYGAYLQAALAEAIVYVMLALLFQPFFKIALGRTIWNVVDLVVSVGLLVSIFVSKKTRR